LSALSLSPGEVGAATGQLRKESAHAASEYFKIEMIITLSF
jgi:hypothetical protein